MSKLGPWDDDDFGLPSEPWRTQMKNLRADLKKAQDDLACLRTILNPESRMYTHNGWTHEIQQPEISDVEVAGIVRMLTRTDLGHEGVCTLARDRILHLTQTLDKAKEILK